MISTNAGSVNPMRQLATVKTITTGTWTGVSSAGVTASWDGEAGEVSDDAPTLAAPTIDAEKAQAFVPGSIEAFDDWAGMESDIRMMFADAKDNLEAAAHITGLGSGSNQPFGIVTGLDGSASEVAPGTVETFAVGDVYALESALPARYRANASFVANKAIFNLVRQFDTSGGAGLWERIGAGQPAQLLGYNAYEASSMDGAFDAAATADNFLLLLGDIRSAFTIVDRLGMNVELVPHLFATGANRPSGQRGLYAWWRTGSKVVNVDAARLLNVATTA
jgi:HK97 family phage major capsid protein